MNFYKHYIGDYQRDTGHLSLAEHGAYRLMLDTFYATGRPLPADRKTLYRLLRAATPVERKAIDAILGQFWETTSEGMVNRRAAVEIEKAEKQADINRQIAIEREKRKRQRLEEIFAPSPCIHPGMEEIIGNGALSDPVHESDKVFEVCRVNNTHIVSTTQPLSCTNRATDGTPDVEQEAAFYGALSREPIHSQNQNQNQNQNKEGCGNLATSFLQGNGSDGQAIAGTADNDRPDKKTVDDESAMRVTDTLSGEPEYVFQDKSCNEKGRKENGAKGGDRHTARDVSASLAKAMQEAGIKAAAGDPRLMALASQGVDVDTVLAACSEAKRARPDESIGMAYVVKIVERWSRDASSILARGARAHGRVCIHEERKKALNELTGRYAANLSPSLSGVPLTLDGSFTEIAKDDSQE